MEGLHYNQQVETEMSWHDNRLHKHIRLQGYKTVSMLNSAEQEIDPAHKC